MTATTMDLTEDQTAAVAKKASKAIRTLNEQIALHRTTRNHAMVALTRPPHNWSRLGVVDHVGVTRTMFLGVYESAPAELPPMKGDPAVIAVREHGKVKALADRLTALRKERDDAIISLLYDFRLPNNKVAELTGVGQVRVAQLRQKALS